MRKTLQSIFDFLLFSNIFMALCAVAQGLVTFYLIGSKPVPEVCFLLFASTLGIYNFSILGTKPKFPEKSPHRRIRWFFEHHRLMITFTIVCLLALAPLFFLMSIESGILLVFLGVISFFYSIPLFTVDGQKFGIRNLPGLKQFLITFVWTVSCVAIPIIESQHLHLTTINMRHTVILVAERFLFYAALTIPFDIRDLFEDSRHGVKTIPVMWGEKNAYLFCQILLAGNFILLLIFNNNGFDASFWAYSLTIALAAWLIFRIKGAKNEYYYFFNIDGVLIVQFLLLFAFSKI
jgi:4-hydroxybenzoate polyprenyltransferase